MARFIFRRDFECVLQNAYHLKGKLFGINEQFPAVIEARRRKLFPVMKQAKRERKTVSMYRDKLFIDGELYTLPENTEANEQNRVGYRDIMRMTP